MLRIIEAFEQLLKELVAVLLPLSMVATLQVLIAWPAHFLIELDLDSAEVSEPAEVKDDLLELPRYLVVVPVVFVVQVARRIWRAFGVVVLPAVVPVGLGFGAAASIESAQYLDDTYNRTTRTIHYVLDRSTS